MIDHVDDLISAGLSSLKIEGRAKSAYYAAIVTGAYRHVIDDVWAGRTPDPIWREEVEKVSHRHYATGFYYGPPGQYLENARYIREWQVVALVEECDETGLATLTLRTNSAPEMSWRQSARTENPSPSRPLLWPMGRASP